MTWGMVEMGLCDNNLDNHLAICYIFIGNLKSERRTTMYVDFLLEANPKKVEVHPRVEGNGKASKEEMNRLVQMNSFLDALQDAGFFVKGTKIKVRKEKSGYVIWLSAPAIKGPWRRINLL